MFNSIAAFPISRTNKTIYRSNWFKDIYKATKNQEKKYRKKLFVGVIAFLSTAAFGYQMNMFSLKKNILETSEKEVPKSEENTK